jgi:hypothetical protein
MPSSNKGGGVNKFHHPIQNPSISHAQTPTRDSIFIITWPLPSKSFRIYHPTVRCYIQWFIIQCLRFKGFYLRSFSFNIRHTSAGPILTGYGAMDVWNGFYASRGNLKLARRNRNFFFKLKNWTFSNSRKFPHYLNWGQTYTILKLQSSSLEASYVGLMKPPTLLQ